MALKNTVVIHKDWLSVTDDMSDAEYRSYMCALFEYAFEGREPEERNLRMLLNLVFRHIDGYKAKYEEVSRKRSENIRKRWERISQEKKSDTNDTSVYKCIQTDTNDTSVYKCIQTDTNDTFITDTNTITKTDTDTITKTDTDTKTDTERESNNKLLSSLENNINNAREAEHFKRFFADERRASLDALAMQLRVPSNRLRTLGEEAMNDWKLTEQTHSDFHDFAKHLTALIRIKAQQTARVKNKENGLGESEYIDDKGRRTYGSGRANIPISAPPRPSGRHAWDEETQKWVLL